MDIIALFWDIDHILFLAVASDQKSAEIRRNTQAKTRAPTKIASTARSYRGSVFTSGAFNFNELLDWMSFFGGSAAKSSEIQRKFQRFLIIHNIYKVLPPAKRTTPQTDN